MSNRLASFRAAIATIATTGEQLVNLIHTTSCEMATHAFDHGDMTLFVDLHNAIHSGVRRKAWVAWLYDFTPIRLKLKDGLAVAKGSRVLKPEEKGFTAWNLAEMEAVTFWDYTMEREPSRLTSEVLIKMVARIGKKLEKAIENDNLGDDVNIDAARKYVAALAAIKPDGVKAE